MSIFKKILGSVSPLYGAISGNGLFGQGAGIVPAMIKSGVKELRTDNKEEGEEGEEGATEEPGMRRGGRVKKMAKGGKVGGRGDGCCTKGKTKGRYV